jgi:hypothetical protein
MYDVFNFLDNVFPTGKQVLLSLFVSSFVLLFHLEKKKEKSRNDDHLHVTPIENMYQEELT